MNVAALGGVEMAICAVVGGGLLVLLALPLVLRFLRARNKEDGR